MLAHVGGGHLAGHHVVGPRGVGDDQDVYKRQVLGLVLLSLVVVGPKTLWGLVGLVPLATGLMRFCPVYPLLGINTCPRA